MSGVYARILQKRTEAGMTWDELAMVAGIRVSSWMTGVPTCDPSDDDIQKLAPVLDTTYEWLKYGEVE